jgi:PAS domain S-box-containing protein
MTTTQLLLDTKMIINSDFFNQSPLSVFIWSNDEEWTIQDVSKNITKLLGYTKDDKIILYSSLIHSADILRVKEEVYSNSSSNKSNFKHDPYRIRKKDGNYIWVKDSTSIVYENDEITHYIGYIQDCTKEIESIQELKDSRQMWINAIENNGDGLWQWNVLTNEVYYSTQWIKMLGFEENEISNSILECEIRIHPEDKNSVERKITDYINGKTNSYVSEHRVLCKDGTYKWVLDRGSITKYTEDGKAEIFTGTHLDITEKKELEKRLEQNNSYKRALIDNLPFLIWLKDKNNNFLKVNQAYANASTLKNPKLLIGKNDFDIWPKELALEYDKDDKKILKSGKSIQIQEKIIIDGEEKWFETFKAPVYDKYKQLLGSIGHAQDITERIKIEETLRLQNEEIELERLKLLAIINSLPDPLWIKDEKGIYISCNREFENFFGAKESEIIGKTDYDFVSKEIADSFRENDKKAMSSNHPVSNYEQLTFVSDGHSKYVHTTKTKVASINGKIYGVLGISRDLSQIKKHQDEIIEQKEEFKNIFDNSMDGIAILDLESNFLNCNNAYCKMLDFTKEELLEKSCIELTIPDDEGKTIAIFEEVIKNGFVRNFEKRCFTKNNKLIYINMSISILPDKKRFLIVTKEVSHLKFLEEQSKLISMGEMLGNIAHQWRQPLSIIATASTGLILQKEYNNLSDEQLIETCTIINENAQYLSTTIEDFRNFITNDKSIESVSIKNAMEYALHLSEPIIKNNYIKLVLDLEDDINIIANRNELAQSFLNILNNAKDALLQKNELNRYIIITTKKVEDKLSLSIIDSAGGIPKNIIERIFEPYFTTKYKSQGRGIGLSMVSKILRDKYNAEIDVYNDTYVYNNINLYGACFKITFSINLDN